MKYFSYVFLLSLLFTFFGCTQAPIANFDQVVKKRASFDFNCPENYVQVIAEGFTRYAAQGCGKKAAYEVKCSIGPCVATQVQ